MNAKWVVGKSDGLGGKFHPLEPRQRFPTYKDALQSLMSADTVVKETGVSGDSTDASNWSWVMTCERQVVHQL